MDESRKLISVDEHNQTKIAEKKALEIKLMSTGVACPKCGKELRWPTKYFYQLEYPAPTKRMAHCSGCSLQISLEI